MVRQNTMCEIEDPAAIELQRGLHLSLERREVEKRIFEIQRLTASAVFHSFRIKDIYVYSMTFSIRNYEIAINLGKLPGDHRCISAWSLHTIRWLLQSVSRRYGRGQLRGADAFQSECRQYQCQLLQQSFPRQQDWRKHSMQSPQSFHLHEAVA